MIKRLVEKPDETVEVQSTTFSVDVLGRYICNTWEEAVNNGGAPFDAIVVGAGMFGAYCAEKIYREGKPSGIRVLVLDAGSYLVSEHVQNLPRIGLNAGKLVAVPSDKEDPGTTERVWGYPWRSTTAFPGLAYCLGGKSLYWGGWAPQLTDADLARWPAAAATYLKSTYPTVETEIGVKPATDYIEGSLYQELLTEFQAAVTSVDNVDSADEAPLAIQGQPPASGLFSFDKYSSAPIFIDALREGPQKNLPDSQRQLFLVPHAHVVKLHTTGGAVTGIEAVVNGKREFLSISPLTSVVIASGTIEATRLALESFPTPSMGRNLMAHLRSNTTVRIHRRAFSPTLPKQLEAAALIARGSTPNGRFHLQVTAAAVQGSNPESVMFQMIPDIELLDNILANQEEDWIVLTLRGIGEMTGDKNASPASSATSWMDLSPNQTDQHGKRRAWVNLVTTQDDENLWDVMDDAAIALAKKIANDDPNNIEYFYNLNGSQNQPGAAFHKDPPPRSEGSDKNDPKNKVRDSIGTTHHEAGTLWMGTSANDSVTNLDGRFHHIANAYVAGPALFPTIGSANPSLTALTLARRTAQVIAGTHGPIVEDDFTALYDGKFDGWQMAGDGRFKRVGSTILESEAGIGLLWYTKEQFEDFTLRLEWRAANPTDNSGVYLRIPALGTADPANDWKPASEQGYEVQIDDRGFNPDTNTRDDPLHQTGAVYKLAPASKVASRPLGQWNEFEIIASKGDIAVTLNGELVAELKNGTRLLTGHIGLQNHHPGSRVQFRNLRIKKH